MFDVRQNTQQWSADPLAGWLVRSGYWQFRGFYNLAAAASLFQLHPQMYSTPYRIFLAEKKVAKAIAAAAAAEQRFAEIATLSLGEERKKVRR